MNFENLQKSWQLQQAPVASTNTAGEQTARDIIIRMKALHRSLLWTNILMTVTVGLTVAFFVFVLRPLLNPNTIWYDTGMGITFGAALFLAFVQWLKSGFWSRQQIDLSSKEFVERALNRFHSLVKMNHKLTPFLMLLILIGINLIFLDIFWNASIKLRIVEQICLNAFMVVVGGLSLYYSKKRRDESYEPVVAELEEIQRQFNML